jgi:eukaryotic-like serine/threonine-protein kinase
MTVLAKAGRYELIEEIGRGAMGVVYRAHDPVIDRTVAVKTLRVSEHTSGLPADELLRRFHTEARAAGLLSHPNIVAVYDAGKEDDFFYITMELVQGKSLQALRGERNAFPLARILRLMQQACAALEFAHQNNVVHRDIKPANLILTPDDTLKISDFGTAKILQFQSAQTGQIVGTPSYMSPEQIKGRPVDGRSDIFSLGGVLYELLTGTKPFPGDSITSVIYKIVGEEPVPPHELDASIHPGLSAIVMRALAKLPDSRFQSCVQFFDALHNYRDYQPGIIPAATPEASGQLVDDLDETSVSVPAELLAVSSEPAKQGNSVWLALFLLAVIGVSGYKVWPPLRDLWLRTKPDPVATMPKEHDAGNAPSESAAADSVPAPAAQAAAPLAAEAPAAAVVSESKSPAGPPPTLTTVAARPQPQPKPALAKPDVSQAAADWREHILGVLAEAGLANRVRVVASGSTLTLSGKLDTGSHRTALGLLQNGPSNVQIVDHIEDTEAASPKVSEQPSAKN